MPGRSTKVPDQPEGGSTPDRHQRSVSEETAYESAGEEAQNLSVPLAEPARSLAKSGLGDRYLLHPHGQGVPIPGGHHGLVQPPGTLLATFEYPGLTELCIEALEEALHCYGALEDPQHPSGGSTHQRSLYQQAQECQRADQHRW